MLKWWGVCLAFGLGYLSASTKVFSKEPIILYLLLALCGSFLLIYWPLEMIAQAESIQNPMTNLRTSARDHLQRRGSF